MNREGQIGLTRQETAQMKNTEVYLQIRRTLESVGFTTDGIECNEDGLKMRATTKEGRVTVCILDLAMRMPQATNRGDPREIVKYIEGCQKERKIEAINKLDSIYRQYVDVMDEPCKNMIKGAMEQIEG